MFNSNNCQIIDVAIPDDRRVRAKEDELGSRKISRFRERNSKDVGHKDKVVGALGTIPLRLKENLRTIGVDISIELIQRCALLGSTRILRKVLEI